MVNEDEHKAIERYLGRYKISNKSRWFRETIISHILNLIPTFVHLKTNTGMKPSKTKIGKEGEQEARSYLEKRGYHIVCTNWHFHHYELDIIAEKEDELIVVEVKTRSEDFLVSPEDAVDEPKIRRIVQAADAYARLFNVELPIRFDIITLTKDAQGVCHVEEHIPDAFYAPLK